jgi:hypothetical protein
MKIFLLPLVAAFICLAASYHQNAAATGPAQTSNVCASNPAPATPDQTQVDTPTAGDTVSSPVRVTGRILAFEATFRITIFGPGGHYSASGATGNTIIDVTAMSADGTMLSPFDAQVPFSVSADTPACLWVYEITGRGDISGVVQVPLTLRAGAGGLPLTGDGSPADAAPWPAAVSLAGMLLALSGATIAIAAARRR